MISVFGHQRILLSGDSYVMLNIQQFKGKKAMTDTAQQFTEEKSKKLKALVKELRLIDDTFFEKVMEDRETCEEVLRTIMGDPELTVTEVSPQEPVHNLQGRSVRLDALCRKADGSYINVEVQRADDDDHFKRVRYNASCITANIAEPGERFRNVKDVCVIYISEFDIFNRGKTIYHTRQVVQETEGSENPVYVEDGFSSIYVNTAVNDHTVVAELMQCFLQTEVENRKFPKLSNRVAQFKKDEKGVIRMCAAVERYAKERCAEAEERCAAAEKREAERILLMVSSLIEKHNFLFEDACHAAQISMEDYEKYNKIASEAAI